MDYTFSQITGEDGELIIDIFNYYIENSFAAYPEEKLPYEAFHKFTQMFQGFPNAKVKNKNGQAIGFGFLRAFNPIRAFSQTAEISYFLESNYTGKGIGTLLLAYLMEEGKKMGIKNILANISSLNPGSVIFHQKNGFTECGRFKNIGLKNNRSFDLVWMQKAL